jgi:PAS domain S-box-containing protein
MPRVRDHEPADRREADLDSAFFRPRSRRNLLKRYGLALALATLALFLRDVLPIPEGAAIYQLPLAAVVLSAWYGGRGPGLFASLISIAGNWYWFVPPVNSFTISPDHRLPFSIFIALCLFLTEFSAGRRRGEQALRESEARFRTFVDHATDGLFLHDEHAVVTDVNRQACESMGYSRDELIGMHPRDFDAGLDAASVAQLGKRVGAGETVTFETRHRRKDGSVFPVEVRVREFQQGERRLHLSIVRDISERKLAEETLRAKDSALETARTELARVSRMTTLGELTASIAHEVNQPLGAMVANAAACVRWLSAQPPDTANARRALESIVAGGRRAGEVIGRIRALVKRQAARKAVIDMNEAIADVVALVRQELRSNDIMLATRLAGDLPSVLGDRVQLQQVLLNLIVNAIEAMAAVADRARELAIASSLDGPDAVVVEVRDSGPGLDAERAEQLFEAFYTTKAEGVGIGLSISRSIVEEHGGRLWAAPNAPHGAVFRFSLPTEGRATR